MWSLLAPPSLADRQPVDIQAFTRHFLPAVLSYYATAVLILIPQTFPIRLAILPITLWCAVHAIQSLDFSYKVDEFAYMNQALAIVMTIIVFRACVWTFRLQPYQRHKGDHVRTTYSTSNIVSDAFDLSFNLRGIGWSWSQGLRVPKETRDVTSTRSFLLSTFIWFLQGLIAFDFCLYAAQSLSPQNVGSPRGGTIFDPTLDPLTRYTHSTIITLLGGFTVYLAVDTLYNFMTLLAIIVFRQSPTLWPPCSDRPYCATSLNEFWTVRWHQSFRDIFIGCGAKPLMYLSGRVGGVMGAFLISGLLHDSGCWGMGRGTDFKRISGFFIINGVGVILEHVFRTVTGKRVEGLPGRIWTYAWLLAWGSMLIEAWMVRGLGGSIFMPSQFRPAAIVLGPLPQLE